MPRGIANNPELKSQRISQKHRGRKCPWMSDLNKSQKMRDMVSRTKTGFKHSVESRKKMAEWHIGWNPSAETRLKMSISHRGELAPAWNGGVTPLYQLVRNNTKSQVWRLSVFERDKFTCTRCGDNKGGNLNADHIERFADIIKKYGVTSLEEALDCERLWDVSNGRTLCEECHRSRPTWDK